jgi:hypothetical protein
MAEKRFLDFMDRFDGGGMGTSGDKFEGGGLLSMLGNIFATPRGSEDRAKQEALAGLLGQTRPSMGQTSAAPQPQPQPQSPLEMFGGQQPAPYSPQPQSPPKMFGGQQPAPYSSPAQGLGMTPANNYAPSGTGPESPLSFEGFTRHIMENYDQGFVRRMLTSPDQYEPAYDLYVRNGGKL